MERLREVSLFVRNLAGRASWQAYVAGFWRWVRAGIGDAPLLNRFALHLVVVFLAVGVVAIGQFSLPEVDFFLPTPTPAPDSWRAHRHQHPYPIAAPTDLSAATSRCSRPRCPTPSWPSGRPTVGHHLHRPAQRQHLGHCPGLWPESRDGSVGQSQGGAGARLAQRGPGARDPAGGRHLLYGPGGRHGRKAGQNLPDLGRQRSSTLR